MFSLFWFVFVFLCYCRYTNTDQAHDCGKTPVDQEMGGRDFACKEGDDQLYFLVRGRSNSSTQEDCRGLAGPKK